VSSFNDAVKQMHADNMGTIEKLFWHDDIGRVRFMFSFAFCLCAQWLVIF